MNTDLRRGDRGRCLQCSFTFSEWGLNACSADSATVSQDWTNQQSKDKNKRISPPQSYIMQESCWKLLIIWYSGSTRLEKTEAMTINPIVQQPQAEKPALLVSSLLLNPFSMTAVLMKSIKQKDRANGGFDFQEANSLFRLLHWAEGPLFSLQCASSHQNARQTSPTVHLAF